MATLDKRGSWYIIYEFDPYGTYFEIYVASGRNASSYGEEAHIAEHLIISKLKNSQYFSAVDGALDAATLRIFGNFRPGKEENAVEAIIDAFSTVEPYKNLYETEKKRVIAEFVGKSHILPVAMDFYRFMREMGNKYPLDLSEIEKITFEDVASYLNVLENYAGYFYYRGPKDITEQIGSFFDTYGSGESKVSIKPLNSKFTIKEVNTLFNADGAIGFLPEGVENPKIYAIHLVGDFTISFYAVPRGVFGLEKIIKLKKKV